MSKCIVLLVVVFCSTQVARAQEDWQHWRGPGRNGVAVDQKGVPTTWSDSENVVWKTKVPGLGNSSPIVASGKVFLTTAEKEGQVSSALCYDLKTGKQLWKTDLHRNGFLKRIYPGNNTHASSTAATDGKSLFVVFCSDNITWLTALDYQGKKLWQKNVCKFVPTKYQFGFGASPVIAGDNVLVTSESDTESVIAAFSCKTGKKAFTIDRPKNTSYSTPVLAHVAGKDQLLMSGSRLVTSYDPSNGKKLWEVPSKWTVSCGTMVWNKDTVFVSGGFPVAQTLAIKADGSGKVLWTNRVKAYEQSLLYYDGLVYAHSDNGAIYCWDAESGEQKWRKRVGNKVSASPLVVNGNIYFYNERGKAWVIKADDEAYELVSENMLGDRTFATPAICGGRIITRVGKKEDGVYQEWLYSLGK